MQNTSQINWKEIADKIGLVTYGGVAFDATGKYRDELRAVIEPLLHKAITEERANTEQELTDILNNCKTERGLRRAVDNYIKSLK